MNKQQWTLLSGIGLGAGLMYLLDPAGGRQRRTLVRNKGSQAWSTGSDVVRRTSKGAADRVLGLLHQGEGPEAEGFDGFEGDTSRWSRLRDSRVVSGLKRRETLGAAALGTVALGLLARNLARRRNGQNGQLVAVEVVEVVTVEEEIPITSFDSLRDEVPVL